MVLDERTKKYLKLFAVLAFVFVFAGCARNLDSNGKLIAERAITSSTPWTPAAGLFDFLLVIPIAKGIIALAGLTGNVLWGVIILTILINILILPIMIKSTVSSQKMQLIQPELEKLQEKYRGRNDQASQLRMQQEMQQIYQKNNVSMLGGFASFLTLPIMFAMWQAVQRVELLYSSTAFGMNLGVTPMSQLGKNWAYIVLIAVMAITQFLSVEINNIMLKRSQKGKRAQQSKQAGSMKTMSITMTIMIVYFGLIMPTAMSFYWITTSIITIIRTIYIQFNYIEKEEKEKQKRVIR